MNATNSRRCEACRKRWPLNWAGSANRNHYCPRCGKVTRIVYQQPDQDADAAAEAYIERLCREADLIRLELGFPLPEEVGREQGRRDAQRLRLRRRLARQQGLAWDVADLEQLLRESP